MSTPGGPAGRPRRIAVLKPDFGVTGGFERVVDRVEATLRGDGHDVHRITVPVNALPRRTFGLEVPDDVWAKAPEYFRYLASIAAFDHVDARRFDVVISTQPPSFATSHPRHLSLFFHHHRVFYDLEDLYVAAGFAADPALHRHCAAKVRELDRPLLGGVSWFLAGSEAVRTRLARFNGIDRVGLFHAGVGDALPDPAAAPRAAATATGGTAEGAGSGAVLCVGRHEFPKRTELFIQAMKHLPGLRGASVGTGGREAWARALDHRLSQPGADLDGLSDAELWCNTGQGAAAVPDRWDSNVAFLGRVDDDELDRLYHEAPCVVAPAHDEDYGLTAVEAMTRGTPVVVCRDGGGLTTLVDDGVDGLVVEPTGKALAEAVDRIASDPGLRAELARGARAKAARITWPRADEQLRAGLREVLG